MFHSHQTLNDTSDTGVSHVWVSSSHCHTSWMLCRFPSSSSQGDDVHGMGKRVGMDGGCQPVACHPTLCVTRTIFSSAEDTNVTYTTNPVGLQRDKGTSSILSGWVVKSAIQLSLVWIYYYSCPKNVLQTTQVSGPANQVSHQKRITRTHHKYFNNTISQQWQASWQTDHSSLIWSELPLFPPPFRNAFLPQLVSGIFTLAVIGGLGYFFLTKDSKDDEDEDDDDDGGKKAKTKRSDNMDDPLADARAIMDKYK